MTCKTKCGGFKLLNTGGSLDVPTADVGVSTQRLIPVWWITLTATLMSCLMMRLHLTYMANP